MGLVAVREVGDGRSTSGELTADCKLLGLCAVGFGAIAILGDGRLSIGLIRLALSGALSSLIAGRSIGCSKDNLGLKADFLL